MKKVLVFVILSFVVMGVLCSRNAISESMEANVEALANGESVSGVIECSGCGKLYCPLTQTNEYSTVIIYQ